MRLIQTIFAYYCRQSESNDKMNRKQRLKMRDRCTDLDKLIDVQNGFGWDVESQKHTNKSRRPMEYQDHARQVF